MSKEGLREVGTIEGEGLWKAAMRSESDASCPQDFTWCAAFDAQTSSW